MICNIQNMQTWETMGSNPPHSWDFTGERRELAELAVCCCSHLPWLARSEMDTGISGPRELNYGSVMHLPAAHPLNSFLQSLPLVWQCLCHLALKEIDLNQGNLHH